ncbi:MAG: phosphate acyltransferase PlsX [bacterium]
MLNTIAIDVMGGDFGPENVLKGVELALQADSDLHVVLAAEQAVIDLFEPIWSRQWDGRYQWQLCGESILMDDSPVVVLRQKKEASIRKMLELVAEQKASGCVSCGNTGAMMVLSRYILKMLPGIDRPAIVRALPSSQGKTYMLDLGANTTATAENLFQFAIMGQALFCALESEKIPKLGLLNIGVEQLKGHDSVRQAGALLEQSTLNYIGFVEGNDIFSERVDVVITDGFTGNTVLKACEGLASFVASRVKASIPGYIFTLSKWLGRGSKKKLLSELNPENYNGASLLGVNGVVVKSHGSSSPEGIAVAIASARAESVGQIPSRIATYLQESEVLI